MSYPSGWQTLDELRADLRARFAARGTRTRWARGAGITIEILLSVLRGTRPPADDLLHLLGYERQIHYRRVDPCGCHRCAREHCEANPVDGVDFRLARYFLCETCGNKRCPHGTDHRLDCTNSNEPGQPGSRYQ